MDQIGAKDKFFYRKWSLNIGGELYQANSPKVMGILNLTPDSFHDGGKYNTGEKLRRRIVEMIEEGADIIDVGAASSRPGSKNIAAGEEIKRLQPALAILKKEFPDTIISIDTWQAEVARAGIDMGGHIVNDISGGTMDKEMINTMAQLKVPYIIMHMQGTPQDMQKNPVYTDVVDEVCYFLSAQIRKFLDAGLNDIIIDPGFGFGKNLHHNYELLNKLQYFQILNKPLLVGVSRKRMINELLNIKAEEALNGTTVVNTIALMKGASILRVHDVKAAVEAVKILTFTQNFN